MEKESINLLQKLQADARGERYPFICCDGDYCNIDHDGDIQKELDTLIDNTAKAIYEDIREFSYENRGDFESKNPEVNWIKAIPEAALLDYIQDKLKEI